MEVKLSDLLHIYENEIKINVKNKRLIFLFEKNKIANICYIKYLLENNLYDGGNYHLFITYIPKARIIMSQDISDKIINHYVTRFVLMPKLSKYLNFRSCATREKMGLDYAIKLLKKELNYYKKYNNIYILKVDIKKYFYNISHQKLLDMIENDLDSYEYKLIKIILDSTDKEYINNIIDKLAIDKGLDLPRYNLSY